MMRAMVALFLVGCGGMSEEDFRAELVTRSCEATMACSEEQGTGVSFSFDSQEDCEAFMGGLLGPVVAGCDYDAAAAGDCLDETEALDCETVNSGGRAGACDAVYSGDGCEW